MDKAARIEYLQKEIARLEKNIERYQKLHEQYLDPNGIYSKLSPDYRKMQADMHARLSSKSIGKKVGYQYELDDLLGKSAKIQAAHTPEEIEQVKKDIADLPGLFNKKASHKAILGDLLNRLEELPEDLVEDRDDVLGMIEDYDDAEPGEKGDIFDEIQEAVNDIKFYEEEMQPEIIKQYPIGDVPKQMDLGGVAVDIPPIKGEGPADYIRREKAKASHPREMTMAEYNEIWKPQGWKIIFIGPTSTWRSEWGIWEAIREIVQNALDETEAYEYGYDDLGFYIKDSGRGIAVSSFLLGPAKLKEPHARGKYGEGMKIGALALIREGYPVYVQSGDREIYIIFLEQEADVKVMSLAAIWRPAAHPIQGTTFHIIGYDGEDYADSFAVNLPKSSIIAEHPSLLWQPKQRYNQLIVGNITQGGSLQGKIFARDIFMRDITSVYSYNLWSFELAPDRHAPLNDSDMWRDIGRLWAGVKEVEQIKTFLRMVTDPHLIESAENYGVRMDWMGKNPSTGEDYEQDMIANEAIWNKAFKEVFGDSAIIRTDSRWDAIVGHLGFKAVGFNYSVRSALSKVIKNDAKLISESQEQLREVKIIEDDKLTPKQLASLMLARAISDKVCWTKPSGIWAAIIPDASDRVRTAGLYGTQTKEIYLAPDQLEQGRSAVDTAIHEIAHHISGAEDGDTRHYQEISRIAGEVVRLTATGVFDDVIRGDDFYWD